LPNLEHGWVADGSTGADDPYYCHICDECLGDFGTDFEDWRGNMICEDCYDKLLLEREDDDE